jgi:hypothetical protein
MIVKCIAHYYPSSQNRNYETVSIYIDSPARHSSIFLREQQEIQSCSERVYYFTNPVYQPAGRTQYL